MSAHYPFDPFALSERPDIPFPPSKVRRDKVTYSKAQRLRRAGVTVLGSIAAVLGLGILIFIPVLVSEFARIEALTIDGREQSATEFAASLEALFMGSLIIGAALVSFLAAAAVAGRDMDVVLHHWTYGNRSSDRFALGEPSRHETLEKVRHV